MPHPPPVSRGIEPLPAAGDVHPGETRAVDADEIEARLSASRFVVEVLRRRPRYLFEYPTERLYVRARATAHPNLVVGE
jgi:hypothetical protein